MHTIAWWATLAVVLVASIFDMRTRLIPNWLVLPFLAAGPAVSGAVLGWHGLQESLSGVLFAAIPMGILYWLGGMGMGDVKLCAAIGAWIGPRQIAVALVAMGITGGVMAIAWALWGGFLKESLDGAGDLLFGARKRGFRKHETLTLGNPKTRKLPYAPAIAVGALFSFLAVTK